MQPNELILIARRRNDRNNVCSLRQRTLQNVTGCVCTGQRARVARGAPLARLAGVTLDTPSGALLYSSVGCGGWTRDAFSCVAVARAFAAGGCWRRRWPWPWASLIGAWWP